VWGRGLAHYDSLANENVVALCDVNEARFGEALKRFPNAKTYVGWRNCLEWHMCWDFGVGQISQHFISHGESPVRSQLMPKLKSPAIGSALTSAPGTSTVTPMDTMKLLLGTTVALLLGALAMSWQGMNYGIKNTSSDELSRLKKQVAELRQEQDNLQLERRLQQLKAATPPTPTPTPAANTAEIEAVKAQVEANKLALAQMEADKDKAKRDAKVAQDEEGLLSQRDIEKGDAELRRARMIGEALLIGKVREYVEDAQLGGFITFEIAMPEQVQVGTLLAIRRKTGILGTLKVSDISPEGGIANPLPGFGPVQPKVGDELILPPQY